MKRKIIRRIAGIYLLMALISGCVYAQYPSSDKTTKANIKFVPNTEQIQPVDPDNPDNPDPGLPAVVGPLVILHASEFSFGTEKVMANKQDIDIQTTKPNIQIADLRGNSEGWALDISITRFQNDALQDTLTGAAILIKDGRLNSATAMTYKPTLHTNKIIGTDENPVRILTAPEGKGQGIWVDCFYPENEVGDPFVQLQIPAGMADTGTHSAIMTWTLKDAP